MLPSLYGEQDINNRKHQINTLKIFNDNVKEIICDKEYEIPFETSTNKLTLKILLSDDFPKEKPILTIQPPIMHPWINENGVIVSAPGLINFTVHSDLGRVVQVIIREIKRHPPQFASFKSQNIPIPKSTDRTNPTAYNKSYSFSPSPPTPASSPLLMPSTTPPPQQLSGQPGINKSSSHAQATSMIPAISNLRNLTIEELRFLNNNEDGQIEFVNDMVDMNDIHMLFDGMVTENLKLAKKNLQKRDQLESLKASIAEKMEEVNKLTSDNDQLYAIYQNLSERYSPRKIQDQLGKAAQSAEESSEKIAEDFLQGKLDIDKFLSNFIKTKTLYHLRKTKEEKLNEQLNRLDKERWLL